MSEELFLEGKTYVSSKRAAVETGYAQDYIGQLARKGLIDAQRVGGLWYVHLESLAQYQRNSASYAPVVPQATPRELDSVVTFDGKDYISASKAAKMTGYNQDYIGQLARSGKILSRQIGNRWYVDREMLLAHKAQKDSLLAAVQADAVGIPRRESFTASQGTPEAESGPFLTYIKEDTKDLMPVIRTSPVLEHAKTPTAARTPDHQPSRVSPIVMDDIRMTPAKKVSRRASRKTMVRAAEFGVALTFVIVLSYGFTTLQSGSIYTVNRVTGPQNASHNIFTASAASAADHVITMLEQWVAPQLTYTRQSTQ